MVLKGHDTATGMTVGSGGTLAGTGIITSSITINSGGTLEPGPPGTAGGTLSVAGNLTFASGAKYLDTIGTATASVATISGTATLGDATVTIAAGSTVTAGTTYTVMVDTSGGLGSGNTFNPAVSFGTLGGTISYVDGGDDVDLVFATLCYTGPFPHTNSGSTRGICVINQTFTGNVNNTNTGIITTSGISVTNSTITGQDLDSGTLTGGITIDSKSKIVSTKTAISITGPMFAGGISNAGTVSGATAIRIINVPASPAASPTPATSSRTAWESGCRARRPSRRHQQCGNVLGNSLAGNLRHRRCSIRQQHNRRRRHHQFWLDRRERHGHWRQRCWTILRRTSTTAAQSPRAAPALRSPTVSSFSGGVTNSGTISAGTTASTSPTSQHFPATFPMPARSSAKTGVAVSSAAALPARSSTPAISWRSMPAFRIDSASKIVDATRTAIAIAGSTFTGGITNAGLIDPKTGIIVSGVSTYSGDVTNIGTINATAIGIKIASVSIFNGNISNSGTISGPTGIAISGSTIHGQIADSGNILASTRGIAIDSASTITTAGASAISITGSTFTGGISNAGTLYRTQRYWYRGGRDDLFRRHHQQRPILSGSYRRHFHLE